jgi:hypothetical protein
MNGREFLADKEESENATCCNKILKIMDNLLSALSSKTLWFEA